MPTSIRLPEEAERRLTELANTTGRTKGYYIKKAILQQLDDLEDIYLAEHRLEQLRQNNDEIINAKEFWSGLDS